MKVKFAEKGNLYEVVNKYYVSYWKIITRIGDKWNMEFMWESFNWNLEKYENTVI